MPSNEEVLKMRSNSDSAIEDNSQDEEDIVQEEDEVNDNESFDGAPEVVLMLDETEDPEADHISIEHEFAALEAN